MIDINYELEFINNKIIFGKPLFISLFFSYKKYDFVISSYYDDLFLDVSSLCGMEIKENGKTLYETGEFNCSDDCGKIKIEKIIKKPIYRNVILNLHKKIKNHLIANNVYYSELYNEIQYLEDKAFNKIMDIWQLIIKNIFSERKE